MASAMKIFRMDLLQIATEGGEGPTMFSLESRSDAKESMNETTLADHITVSGRFAVSECLDHPLCNPFGRWVIGDVEVEHFPPAMLQHQEHEQDSQPDRRYRKKVNRRDLGEVIAQKRLPSGFRSIDPYPRLSGFRRRSPKNGQPSQPGTNPGFELASL
jgi:hypothetical protein